MVAAIHHSQATGIHPSAYVQDTAPTTTDVQDHVLWIDTSTGAPPYQLKVWYATEPGWRAVGIVGSGVDDTGHLATSCLTYPNGAELCNPSADLVTLVTPTGEHHWDGTGYTLPGGHRLERVAP